MTKGRAGSGGGPIRASGFAAASRARAAGRSVRAAGCAAGRSARFAGAPWASRTSNTAAASGPSRRSAAWPGRTARRARGPARQRRELLGRLGLARIDDGEDGDPALGARQDLEQHAELLGTLAKLTAWSRHGARARPASARGARPGRPRADPRPASASRARRVPAACLSAATRRRRRRTASARRSAWKSARKGMGRPYRGRGAGERPGRRICARTTACSRRHP